MRKILLFDIDGTLILTGGAGGDALHEALQIEFSLDSPRRVPLHGRTDHGIVQELLDANGLPKTDDHVSRVKECYFRILPGSLANRQGKVLPGVVELLKQLESDGRWVRSLLTGNMARSAGMKLSHYGLETMFRGGVFGDAHADRRDLGRAALPLVREQFGEKVQAEDVLIIGDTTLDIDCARALGCPVLAVATGGATREELEAHGADLAIDDLQDTRRVMEWIDMAIG